MATIQDVYILRLIWRMDPCSWGEMTTDQTRARNQRFRRRFNEILARMGDVSDKTVLDERSEVLYKRTSEEWRAIQPMIH